MRPLGTHLAYYHTLLFKYTKESRNLRTRRTREPVHLPSSSCKSVEEKNIFVARELTI
jgi:hypothetical protein